MKRAVFFEDLDNAQTSLKSIKKDFEGYSQQMKRVSGRLSAVDQDYRKVSQSITNRANGISEFARQLGEGAKILDGVSEYYLTAERTIYTSISGIKIADGSSRFSLSEDHIRLIYSLSTAPIHTLDIDTLNTIRKGVNGFDDFFDYFNETGWSDKIGFIDDLKKMEIFQVLDTVKYIADAQKYIEASKNKDIEGMLDLLEKYAGKGAEILLEEAGVGSFAAKGYVALGKTFVENVGEEIGLYMSGDPSRSGIVGAAYTFWNLTGNVLVETGLETGWDIVDNSAKLFGIDMDQVYIDLTGKPGLEGFGIGVGMIFDETASFFSSLLS